MATRRRDCLPEQAGIATVWGAAWIVCCLSIGWLALLVTAAVARQHHLDGSADLVALSAATALQDGGDACAGAERAARANNVELMTCERDGGDVIVTVHDQVRLPLGILAHITASARAGPG